MKEFMGVSQPYSFPRIPQSSHSPNHFPTINFHQVISAPPTQPPPSLFPNPLTLLAPLTPALPNTPHKTPETNPPPHAQMFSSLVDRCFDHCIDDFTTKSLIAREQGCVSRCVQKFMAGSERIGQRFAEQQAQMMNGQGGGR
jgi:mitochondrial import inner membrane translocase subunit TIM9